MKLCKMTSKRNIIDVEKRGKRENKNKKEKIQKKGDKETREIVGGNQEWMMRERMQGGVNQGNRKNKKIQKVKRREIKE